MRASEAREARRLIAGRIPGLGEGDVEVYEEWDGARREWGVCFGRGLLDSFALDAIDAVARECGAGEVLVAPAAEYDELTVTIS